MMHKKEVHDRETLKPAIHIISLWKVNLSLLLKMLHETDCINFLIFSLYLNFKFISASLLSHPDVTPFKSIDNPKALVFPTCSGSKKFPWRQDDTSGWYYSHPNACASHPPGGYWTTEGYTGRDAYPAPMVSG